uniref:Uncharacterized protein n=1 Tax=Panagrolaimus superbus TaxID=310955 RepID=A0A914Z7M9_9BILA
MSQCVSTLPLPAYFPAALSLAIAAVSALIIFIAYCIRERKLRKTFYGITDEMEEDEKQQEEAEALGRFDGEVKVIQSMEKLGPHSIAPTPGSQVKVMMKRRRPAGSTKPPTTSREMLCSTSALTPHLHHPSVSPQIECEFKFSIEANQNGFATEIIESLKSLIIEEVYRARTANPHQKQLLSEDETRIGEFIVAEMRAKLESLTNNNPWICHGRLINNTNWVVNGHENLLCSHTNMMLSIKITIEQPISIVLLGYSLKHMGSSGSCITPAPLTTPSKDKLHPSAQIDSTPHPTDPM